MNLAEQTAATMPAPPLKQCPCGAVHTHNEWSALPLVGHYDDGEGGRLELRNCQCRSTINITIPRLQ